MDCRDHADRIEPTLAAEAIEPAERIEPAEPIDKIEPKEPSDRIEPVEPIDRIDRCLLLSKRECARFHQAASPSGVAVPV
jgi:hypothetical protein